MTFIAMILLVTPPAQHGGRAVTEIPFTTMEACEAAGKVIVERLGNASGNYQVKYACISK